MQIVAGLSLKNMEPRVWDPASPFYIPDLSAVMVSYAEYHQLPWKRRKAMEEGLRGQLGVPDRLDVYLDNGAFFFARSPGGAASLDAYEEFVNEAHPDWKPIPQDYIPSPSMEPHEQRTCFEMTMDINRRYQHNGYVPVIHIGSLIDEYTSNIIADENLSRKDSIALGGIVPNLLRKPKAMPLSGVLQGLYHVRTVFEGKSIHVFGVGGTATLHLTSLLGFDSVDSSGWRNRAARGIIQLLGSGERLMAGLGKWRGRQPSAADLEQLESCRCPACRTYGIESLRANRMHGFACRATHNLWVLHEENRWIQSHIADLTYSDMLIERVDNSTYLPIIRELLRIIGEDGLSSRRWQKAKEKRSGRFETSKSEQ